MANDNPAGPKDSSDDCGQSPTEKHQIVAAIQSLESQHRSARQNPTDYEREGHRWAVRTGKGVIIYTILTAIIMVASVSAAIYSRWQATIADDTEKRSLRAYIGIDNEKFILNCAACDNPTKQTDVVRVTDDNALFIEIKNFGHTPAFDAIGHFNWKEAPYGSELSPDFFYADGSQVRVPGIAFVINPQETDHGGGFLGPEDIDLIRRARQHQITLYLYGHFDYTDVFKCRDTLKFCFRYAPDASPEHRFGMCRAHNETPKDCQSSSK